MFVYQSCEQRQCTYQCIFCVKKDQMQPLAIILASKHHLQLNEIRAVGFYGFFLSNREKCHPSLSTPLT